MNILKRPMLYAAVVCSISAAISLFTKLFSFVILFVAVICIFGVVIFKKYNYILVALSIILFAVSLYSQFKNIDNLNKLHTQNLKGEFIVLSEIEPYEDFNIITFKTTKQNSLPNNTKLLVFDEKKTKLKMGDVVKAELKISAIDHYDEYRQLNYSNGIYATANCEKLIKTNDSDLFFKTVGKIRKYTKKIITSYCDGDKAAFLFALTTGDKTLISDKFLANVKTTGISHIIVVSGLHLSIIMSAVFWCLDRLFYNKYIRAFLSVLFVLIIYTLCGFTMSITRAGVMFIIAGISPVFSRDNDLLNSLLTAVVFVLIGSPFAIFNVSFQLSVLSTLSIIWVLPFYCRRVIEKFNISSKIFKIIINTTLCSVFAIIFTLPVTIKTFGFVSIVAPITNLIIMYPVNIALILSIVALSLQAVPVVSLIARALFYVTTWCANFVVFTVNTLAKLPITVAVLPKNAFVFSIILIAIVIGYMYYYEYKKGRKWS